MTVLVVLAMLSAMPGGAAAESLDRPNYSDKNVDSVYIYEQRIDIATHDRASMSSLKQFNNDNGEAETLPVEFNKSIDNRVGVHYDKIESGAYTQFPRDKSYSAINASHWTVGGTNSTQLDVTERDGSTAEGVEAIGFASTSMESGDDAHANFSNVSITSDASKRVPLMGVNVNSLESGAEVQVEYVDADGDVKQFVINSSLSASKAHVLANATGTGYLTQERLNNVATTGSGDGTFAEIQTVRVEVVGGDADTTLYALDTERKSFVDLGSKLEQLDDDDELESTSIEDVESSGSVRLEDLSTMGSSFDAAEIHDLSVFGLKWTAEQLESSDRYNYTASNADSYAGYKHKLDRVERLKVRQAIDLSHHALELRVEQANVGERYKTAQVAEGSTSDLSDVSSWSSFSMGNEGDTVVVDSTVQPGTNYDINLVVLYQGDEWDAVLGNTGGSTGSNPSAGGYGNIPLIGGIIVAILGAFKARGD